MPGKAIVAATEEMLMMAPPGCIARSPCLSPSAVPRTLTSSIRLRSSGSTLTIRPEISIPALLTRMSNPPSCSTVAPIAASQLLLSVTSRCSDLPPNPAAVSAARSSSRSPIITAAPAAASACAIPAPNPRAPPVTSACRPASTSSAIRLLLRPLDCHGPYGGALTVVKESLDSCPDTAGTLRVMGAATARRGAADKVEERRRELAGAALQTLSERGYARTSLREIAQNSPFSHGVVHYYFADKAELITYCVRQYKADCVQRYDGIVERSTSADGLAGDFADALVTTLVEDAHMHRLWYDLRSQALFEAAFREDVLEIDATLERMIWQVVARYAALRGAPVAMPSSRSYATFDGLFQQALLRHLSGREA